MRGCARLPSGEFGGSLSACGGRRPFPSRVVCGVCYFGSSVDFCRQVVVLVVGAESVVSLGASRRHRGGCDPIVAERYLPADNLGSGSSFQVRRRCVRGLVYCALVGDASLLSGACMGFCRGLHGVWIARGAQLVLGASASVCQTEASHRLRKCFN